MTTIHKTYNPKNSSVKDIYMVDDDGHDRWFIPMLADTKTDTGMATMDQQLDQCKKLSPHGEGKDEHPDLPLAIIQDGYVTGSLMMGQDAVGYAAVFSGGAKPYTIKVQIQLSTTGSGGWSDWGGVKTPDEVGRVIWTNTTATAGKYYRLVTTCTDAEGAILVDTQPDSYGPVQNVNAQMVSAPDPLYQDLEPGVTGEYSWQGATAYSPSYAIEIALADGGSAFLNLPRNTNHASYINGAYPTANLETLQWTTGGAGNDGWFTLTVKRSATGGEDISFDFKGIVTDTYSTLSDTAEVTFELTLT